MFSNCCPCVCKKFSTVNDLYQYFDLTKLILVASIVFLLISSMLHVGNIYECLMVKRQSMTLKVHIWIKQILCFMEVYF